MLIPRLVVGMFSVGLMVLGTGVVSGQDFPNKPVRIITSEAGGGADVVARIIAQEISGLLGEQVIIDNRAARVVGELASRAPPDGYTLLFQSSRIWVDPLIRKMPYDPVRDFSPISLTSSSPHILVVHPSLPVRSVKELIALAKARPGELNFGAGGIGSSTHLAAELFKSMTGVNIVDIAYKGGGLAVIGLLGGEVHLQFATAPSVAHHVKSGRLRGLAVTSAQPSAQFPGLPTVAASGVPGYDAVILFGVFAPSRTPAAIISRLNREIVQVLERTDVREKFFNAGMDVVSGSPEQLAAAIKSEMVRVGKLIKDAGIKVEY